MCRVFLGGQQTPAEPCDSQPSARHGKREVGPIIVVTVLIPLLFGKCRVKAFVPGLWAFFPVLLVDVFTQLEENVPWVNSSYKKVLGVNVCCYCFFISEQILGL